MLDSAIKSESKEKLVQAANTGNKNAMTLLARAYWKGLYGFEKNETHAQKLLMKSCDNLSKQANLAGCLNLGSMYLAGAGGQKITCKQKNTFPAVVPLGFMQAVKVFYKHQI